MAITGFSAPEKIGLSCERADASQQQVFDLPATKSAVVLGAPGTGKTSVVIELVARRVERDGWSADDILVLTPNRLAANRLRDAIATRLAAIDEANGSAAASGPRARTPMSLAFSIAVDEAIARDKNPVRLLTGAEQDIIFSDLLAGEIHDGAKSWPDELHDDIRVRRVFRTELRELFGRAQEHGLTADELDRLGAELGVPAWQAAAKFWRQYSNVVAQARPDHFDAAELLSVAAGALADPVVVPDVKLVILDDAQEATAGVIGLLRAFASRGVPVIVLGDPDVATTTFRGAVPEFLGRTASDLGLPVDSVDQIVLETVHRHGVAIRQVVNAFVPLGSALAVGQRRATAAEAGASGSISEPGDVTSVSEAPVLTVLRDSRTNEISALGRILREQHLVRGVPWNRMAVVTRNGAQVSAYARGLAVVDVPTRSLISESSLQQHAMTRDMMRIIKMALGRESITRESVAEMLTSPFGGLSSLELRRLRLAFRHDGLAAGNFLPGGDRLVDALRNPALFASFDFGPSRRAAHVAETLALVASEASAGASIEELLWTVWSRSGLAKSWREAALSSGIAADEANRNLDAIIALFTAARRFVERQPDAPAEQFITEFERADVPEDSLAPQADSSSVLVATPSGVIGAEYDVVVVAGVQENVWPNLRPRGSLLFPQRLVRHLRGQDAQTVDARREVSDDERRMFAMAAGRARHVLVISAHSGEDDMPSPYFERAANRSFRVPESDDDRVYSLRGLVGSLRRRLVLGGLGDSEAARALRKLADAEVAGAHPDSWLGVRGWSTELPVIDRWSDDDHERVRLSPSKLEAWEKDQIVWFIDSIVSSEKTPASGLGTLLHSAMETVAPAGVSTGTVSGDELMSVVNTHWPELETAFEAEWQSKTEKRRATKLAEAIAQYLSNFDAAGGTLLSNEGAFQIVLDIDDERDADPADVERGPIRLTVSGKIDRVEQNADGSVVIADLKTGSAASFKVKELHQNGQLTCYQLAVRAQAIDGVPADVPSGGAKLIFAAASNATTLYTERLQPAGDEAFFDAAVERLRKAARGMAGASFRGRVFQAEEQGEFSSRYEYRIHLVKAVTE